MIAIWSSTVKGVPSACFRISTLRFPFSITFRVAASRSEPNLAKASNSRNCAWSSFSVPATFFIDLICALPPTRDTEIPTLIAGRTPELNRSDSRSEEHTSELQSRPHLVCRLLLEKKKKNYKTYNHQ